MAGEKPATVGKRKKKVTISELYAACVGQGGMSPDYFKRSATIREIELYMKGVNDRERAAWEQARYIAFYAARPHCKDLTFAAMGKFPWEKKEETPGLAAMTAEQQEAALAALRERAAKRDKAYFENLTKNNNGRRDVCEVIAEQQGL